MKPTITDNNGHGTRANHPAFAQISAHRSHGGAAVLYGSDFVHGNVVRIAIKRSELVRDLSHDWHHGNEELIEVFLSESQWATFVSSMNMGDGTPCTLHRIQGETMPDIDLENRTDQFAAETDGKLAGVDDALKEAIEALDSLGAPKSRTAAVREKLERARTQVRSNIPFVAKSFGEHMERTVDKARAEIHGYMNATMQRLGLASTEHKPLELGAPSAGEDDAQ